MRFYSSTPSAYVSDGFCLTGSHIARVDDREEVLDIYHLSARRKPQRPKGLPAKVLLYLASMGPGGATASAIFAAVGQGRTLAAVSSAIWKRREWFANGGRGLAWTLTREGLEAAEKEKLRRRHGQ